MCKSRKRRINMVGPWEMTPGTQLLYIKSLMRGNYWDVSTNHICKEKKLNVSLNDRTPSNSSSFLFVEAKIAKLRFTSKGFFWTASIQRPSVLRQLFTPVVGYTMAHHYFNFWSTKNVSQIRQFHKIQFYAEKVTLNTIWSIRTKWGY